MKVATLVAVAAAALTACSSSDDSPADADFNKADVSFAQDMIPHHRQATEMAALAKTRTDTAAVLELAADIEAAQGPEIDTMTGWLNKWGKDVPAEGDDMGGMDHSNMGGDSSSMPGMMSDDQLAELEASSGAGFDQMFLTMMLAHHEGAVQMAKAEQSDGKNADAKALAGTIRKDQTAEIATMRDLLGS
ncbi:DUF305 domain-containing protein [Aeromicrobium sp. CFBP 8757]|uniref:DUF305 domain-containing protein n=1 Tax=Aeromicrobium sp. CFBP 8757 TaxID=2775288 RepID=UPI00177A8645|nr:DUF305 domain-containing protein [Aeromicrobium sp. CFBP 8757]MBD8607556.1 DUF305 domain-containing protein [Aeromicrobium sp. CFBP 8757]